MSKRMALFIAVMLPLAAFGGVAAFVHDTLRLDSSAPPGRECRAALAIRDAVTPFQEWGSRTFTWGYLHRYYDAAWYMTQAKKGDLKEEFLGCLDGLLQRYPEVDVFLLAHTNKYIDWVSELPLERRQRLRLVYNTGCHNQRQAERWLELGADTYIGHPGESWSSVFYYFFLRRWTRGETVQEATEASNALMETAFRKVQLAYFGRWTAEELMRESEASIFGQAQLRLEACRP